jgi:hypothetical protein
MSLHARIFFLIFCYATVNSYAQNTRPWSSQFILPELKAILSFPEPIEKIEQALNKEKNNPSALKAWVYAVNIETSLNPQTSGQWDTIPETGYVWRVGIFAENALSLNLFIEKYRMASGMALYTYNTENTAGPYDARNNGNRGVLPVQSLPGDMLIIEWNIPLNAVQRNYFTIASIGYGFRDIADYGKRVPSASAEDCNVDVNCRTGNHWQREIRSVVKLQIMTKKETLLCTGTLVNQAVDADHKKPYVLTANHCVSTDEQAQATTFIFRYEKPYCDDPTVTSLPGISGARLIASKRELDFTLLEINSDIAPAYQPYYAGWNASGATPQSAAGIHHPQGDVKKIAISNSPLEKSTFKSPSDNLYCDDNAHWLVKQWHEGTTERGSSGSSIFDDEHKIVGTLSGGDATCANPVRDQYSKFSEQWYRYKDERECLKPWLDPSNKGIKELYGYDPIAEYEGDYDLLGNIGDNEKEILIESGGWGYLTSQNDRGWISFAEKIKNDSVANIMGMEVHVAKVSQSGAFVQFAVWSGSDFPLEQPLYVKNMVVSPVYSDYMYHVYFDRMIEIEGDFFIGYRIQYDDPVDTFAVYQSKIRQYEGIQSMYVKHEGGVWMSLDEYIPLTYSSLGIRAMGRFYKPSYYKYSYRELKVIYQPGSGIANVLFDIENPSFVLQSVRIECYDTSGKRMLSVNKVNEQITMYDGTVCLNVELNVNSLPPGVYLIQIFDKNNKRAGKFVKML